MMKMKTSQPSTRTPSIGTSSLEAGPPSSVVETPPPAQNTQQQAPTTTAVSKDLEDPLLTFHLHAVEVQQEMAVQVQVGFDSLAAKLDRVHGCLSTIQDHLPTITDTHSPLHDLQHPMADIAGVLTQRQEQLSSQSDSSDVTRELRHMRMIMENMERMQASDLAATAAHHRDVAGIFQSLQLLITAVLPQGLAQMNASEASTSTSQPPDVSVPHSAPANLTLRTREAHNTSEDYDVDNLTFLQRRKR